MNWGQGRLTLSLSPGDGIWQALDFGTVRRDILGLYAGEGRRLLFTGADRYLLQKRDA